MVKKSDGLYIEEVSSNQFKAEMDIIGVGHWPFGTRIPRKNLVWRVPNY